MNRSCGVAICAISGILASVTPSSAIRGAADQQITVSQLFIDGADSLSYSQIQQVKASIVGKTDTAEVLMDTARHLITDMLNSACYIRPDIELGVVNKADTPDSAGMHATVRRGTQYRLRNFRVRWAQAFSAQAIGQQLPLDDMRRANCSGLANVESTLTDFYQRRGYRNVKVNSLVQPNKATEQFDLTLYIDERK